MENKRRLTSAEIAKNLSQQVEGTDSNYSITLQDLRDTSSKESLINMVKDIRKYNAMLQQKITFVNKILTNAVPLTMENLYLMCAYSGNGKSSLAANIAEPLWQEKKKALIISNEESKQDVYFRIACLNLGLDFNDYKKGRMSGQDQVKATMLFPEIAKYIDVFDVDNKDGATSTLEGVIEILEAARNGGYSCIMLDYYQNIIRSINEPSMSKYEILDHFRSYLMRYIKNSNVPVVVCVQLHSLGKRNNKDLDSRIIAGPTIYQAATVVIEMVPNFTNWTTNFLIKKDRFGLTGHRVELGFDNGRYVEIDDEFKRKVSQKQVKGIHEKLSRIDDMEEED